LTADLEQTTVQYEELTHQREALNTQINAGLYEKQRRAQAAGTIHNYTLYALLYTILNTFYNVLY
jgi:hypothetical protein